MVMMVPEKPATPMISTVAMPREKWRGVNAAAKCSAVMDKATAEAMTTEAMTTEAMAHVGSSACPKAAAMKGMRHAVKSTTMKRASSMEAARSSVEAAAMEAASAVETAAAVTATAAAVKLNCLNAGRRLHRRHRAGIDQRHRFGALNRRNRCHRHDSSRQSGVSDKTDTV
jgi:hypothetical protein